MQVLRAGVRLATIPFYPRTTVPEKDCYDYSYVDHALSFLLDKGITPKGHPLWFGHQDVNPKWLFGLPYPGTAPGSREHRAPSRQHLSRHDSVLGRHERSARLGKLLRADAGTAD